MTTKIDFHEVIETPARGVFLSQTGDLLTHIPAETKVLPMTALRNATLTLSAFGNPIRSLSDARMSPDGSPAGNVSVKVASGLEYVAAGVAAYTEAVDVVEKTVTVLEWMGILEEKPNPFEELYQGFLRALKAHLRKTLGGFTALTLQNIAAALSHGVNSGRIAHDMLTGKQVTAGLLSQADYFSRYAVTALSDEAYWKRTFDEEAVSIHGPLSVLPQPDADNLVWDYRLPMLALFRAIGCRLAVIAVIDPAFQTNGTFHDEIMGYVRLVRRLEERIRGGFGKAILIPPSYPWKLVAFSCGVVDIHTGASDFDSTWFPHPAYLDPMEYAMGYKFPETYEELQRMHGHCNELRFWRLYDRLGLFELWKIIADLQVAAGPPRERDKIPLRDQMVATASLADLLPGDTKKMKRRFDLTAQTKAALRDPGLFAVE